MKYITLLTIVLITAILASACTDEPAAPTNETTPVEPPVPAIDSEFCGTSTNAPCTIDTDCQAGGCSGHVCQSREEEPMITTCEYRECYNAKKYSVSCRCTQNKCQWTSVLG